MGYVSLKEAVKATRGKLTAAQIRYRMDKGVIRSTEPDPFSKRRKPLLEDVLKWVPDDPKESTDVDNTHT